MAEQIPIIFTPGYRETYHISYQTPPWDRHWGAPYVSVTQGRVLQALSGAGYKPHYFQPNWRVKDPRLWAEALIDQAAQIVQNRDRNDVVLAGFSFGALTSVLAAERLERDTNPPVTLRGVIAGSLSPYFGRHQVGRVVASGVYPPEMSCELHDNFSQLTLPHLQTPVQLYAGTEEIDCIRDIYAEALDLWPNAEGIQPPCAHNIRDDVYLRALEQNAGRLLLAATAEAA